MKGHHPSSERLPLPKKAWTRLVLSIFAVLGTIMFVQKAISTHSTSSSTGRSSSALLSYSQPAKGQVPCHGGWVLDQINPSMRSHIEEVSATWYQGLGATLRQAYNNASAMEKIYGPVSEPWGAARFDVFMPAVPEACPTLKRLGASGDGGKILCGIEHIPDNPEEPCIVYSIGSKHQWDFETAILEATSCTVHTFDCTIQGRVPDAIQERATFHKICLGKAGKDAIGDFKTLKEIMTMLGHQRITLLKADIEGYEYSMFESLLFEGGVPLPEQISFELHYQTQMKDLDWYGRGVTAGEIAMLARSIYEAGYRLISREDNKRCPHCTEMTIIRTLC